MEASATEKTTEQYSKSQSVLVAVGLAIVPLFLGAIVNYVYSPYGLHRAPSGIEYIGSGIAYYALVLGLVAVFLRTSGWGQQYLDVRLPRGRTWLWTGGGVIAIVAVLILFGTLTTMLDLPVAENNILTPLLEQSIEDDLSLSTVTLATLLLVVVIVPPVEELLHRNLIQKLLGEQLSPAGAIGGASLLFALGHIPAYYSPTLSATAVALILTFLGGVVFGVVYHAMENLVAATIVHAFLNLLGFLPIYLGGVAVAEALLPLG